MKQDYSVWAVCMCAIIAICLALLSILTPNAQADSDPVQKSSENVRLPGDDIPATTVCYMTDEEVQEDYENLKIEDALLSKATRIDNVTVTHYCTCEKCCGWSTGITASGVMATPGVSIAVDPSIIPLGSDVLVDYGDGEIHYYRADDTGSGVNGNHIDVCVESHDAALQLGVKTATIWWVSHEQ